MIWLSVVLWVILLVGAVWEALRGFGKAIFDALLLYAALWLATQATHPAATYVHLAAQSDLNHAYVFAGLFVLFGILALVMSRFIYSTTVFSLGMLDGLLGLWAGIAAGMILCHAVTCVVSYANADSGNGDTMVAESSIGNEMYNFTTYHSVMTTLENATGGPMKNAPDGTTN